MRARLNSAISFAVLVISLAFQGMSACASTVGGDNFQSYTDANPAAATLVGPLTWQYIDGLSNGVLANEHRTFTATGQYADLTKGWMGQENGGGMSTTISLASLAGTPYDAGGGQIIAGAEFTVSFMVAPYTTDVLRSVDFNYSIASSGGTLTFQSGGSQDLAQAVVFDSLNDSGNVFGGAFGKEARRRFEVNFTGTGLSLSDTLNFSFVRVSGTTNANMFFDDFQVLAQDGVTDDMILTVDRNTGSISLANSTLAAANSVIGYSVLSTAGSLLQAGWDKQSTGSQLANDNDQWTVLTGTGITSDLSEAVLTTTGDGDGGNLAALNGAWNFGNIWNKSPYQDIRLELLLDDGTILSTGAGDIVVQYTGDEIISGDFAGPGNTGPDGDINTLDWVRFRTNLMANVSSLSITNAYQKGDMNGDLKIDVNDYILFVSAFDDANGIGAFQAMLTNVPEPCTVLLISCGLGVCLLRRSVTSAL
jgi:hypothetical protein